MFRYFLTLFAVVCVALIGVAGWQGKKSKNNPLLGPRLFNNMDNQSKYRDLGGNDFAGFEDHRNARPEIAGTVARGSLNNETTVFSGVYVAAAEKNAEFTTGKDAAGKFIEGFPKYSLEPAADGKGFKPFVLDNATLDLGRRKFEIYCMVCHGPAADGNGIMKRRGEVEGDESIAAIANLQGDVYRKYPNGQIFDVITHGAKTMLTYGDKLTPAERWAVISYLRALQLSQNCPSALVPAGVDKANLK